MSRSTGRRRRVFAARRRVLPFKLISALFRDVSLQPPTMLRLALTVLASFLLLGVPSASATALWKRQAVLADGRFMQYGKIE